MGDLINLLSQYWIVPVGVAVLAAPSVVSFIRDRVSKISLPKLSSFKAKPVVSDDLVSQDLDAIQWLANRAVDVNDKELILELENVNKKFFHIHRAMRKPAVSAE